MIETAGGLGFAPETRERFLRIGVITQHPLHGDDATRMTLTRAVDHTHSAASDFFEDLVVPKPPVFIRDCYFGENAAECFAGARVIGFKAGLKKATDTKAAANVGGRFAMRTRRRLRDHACDRIGKARGEMFHEFSLEPAARTPHKCRIS